MAYRRCYDAAEQASHEKPAEEGENAAYARSVPGVAGIYIEIIDFTCAKFHR